jgi:hypothetical protein
VVGTVVVRSFDEVAVELLELHPWAQEPHGGTVRYRPGQVVVEPARAPDGSAVLVGAWTSHDGDGLYVAAFTLGEHGAELAASAFRRDDRGIREVRVPAGFRTPAALAPAILDGGGSRRLASPRWLRWSIPLRHGRVLAVA